MQDFFEILFTNLELYVIVLLFLVAFIAGFVDSIAGGGGMITIPALLLTGISPLEALATNKLQSSFGSFSATLHFYKKGYLHLKASLPFALLVFVFSAFGTIAVQFVQIAFLSKILPFLIFLFGIYFLCMPNIKESKTRTNYALLTFMLAAIGLYDGFFGPGTGSFFMLSLLVVGGFNLTQSLAGAKLYNFSTNIASLIFFALGGHMLFGIGLVMGFGQIIGAKVGVHLAIRYGRWIIKPLIVAVSFIMASKLLYEQFFT